MINITCHIVEQEANTLTLTLFVYRVDYFIEGVRVGSIESPDLGVCLTEIKKHMLMDMGHTKGKMFTTGPDKRP